MSRVCERIEDGLAGVDKPLGKMLDNISITAVANFAPAYI